MILSGKSRLAGAMGWPVAHSLSPRVHGFWLDHHGIDGTYQPLPVRPAQFTSALRSFAEMGFRGVDTSLGMTGQSALDLDLTALPAIALASDIVYKPLETPLLAAARERVNPVVDGLAMLPHQARPGFEAWFGVVPKVTAEQRAFALAA